MFDYFCWYAGIPKNIKNRSHMGSKVDAKLNIPWSRQKTSLEAHLDHILVPSWRNLAPRWGQVGSISAPSWSTRIPTWTQLGATWPNLAPNLASS